MDFAFSAEEQQFRTDVRRFLAAELPTWWRGLWAGDERTTATTVAICQRLAKRGWLTMSWPAEHGGGNADLWSQMILREEMWAHGEPRGPQYMNVNYIGPLIMRFGTAAQRERFLPPMAAGEALWCQGFSEPDAGSDLAAVSTRAEEVDGAFVVNGQKVWTSYADAPAQWCLLLVRTGSVDARHRALSILLVDMTSAGITVRPVRSLAGPGELNEVFFDNVVVPAECLLGERNGAWAMIMHGLALERAGAGWHAGVARLLDALIAELRRPSHAGSALADRADLRPRLAELYCRAEGARLLAYRVVSVLGRNEDPTVESAEAMIEGAQLAQFAAEVAFEVLGPLAQLTDDDEAAPLGGLAARQWLESIPATIAGGTVDIQRNIVAQRGFGLPRSG